MKFMKKIALIMMCTVFIIPQTGCGSEGRVSENQFLLDTICTITVDGMQKDEAGQIIAHAFETCRDYENMLSKTVKGSDVYRLNHAGGKPVTVQEETLKLIRKGIRYGRLSDGMFDITIGALSDLWDFSGDNPVVPDEKALKKAVDTVDYRQIRIQENEVSLENPEAQMDLGGIAKGYIADRLAEQMKKEGVQQGIISLGGNIVVLGEKEKGVPWKIGIERPYSNRSEILGTVGLTDGTIATSGIYERCFTQDGKLYHHVLNPGTGYPVESALEAVAVKGGEGQSMDCDAMGTVCLMLGEEKGREALENIPGLQAAFIDQEDRITTTDGLEIVPVQGERGEAS